MSCSEKESSGMSQHCEFDPQVYLLGVAAE